MDVITFLTTDKADQVEREIMRREVEGLTPLVYAKDARDKVTALDDYRRRPAHRERGARAA